MDFKKAAELLSLCKEYDKPISQIMMDRECEMTEKPLDEIRSRMAVSLQIMKDATKEAINQPSQSMGGLKAENCLTCSPPGKILPAI